MYQCVGDKMYQFVTRIWKSGNTKYQKMTTLKIKVSVAQNVGKVWTSRKQNILAPFGAILGHCVHGHKEQELRDVCLFPLGGLPICPLWAALSSGLCQLLRPQGKQGSPQREHRTQTRALNRYRALFWVP